MDCLPCPLCLDTGDKTIIFQSRSRTSYRRCSVCDLIFIDPAALPTPEMEKETYLYHQNSPDHPGYVEFLKRIIDPALTRISPGMRGLDYGCGPGPTISVLLGRQGINCCNYDPVFFPEQPRGSFDFIFATECFEHFHAPFREMRCLSRLLRAGGYLFVMTRLWREEMDFGNWYYKNDPTHVSFYHRRTFDFICNTCGFELLEVQDEHILLLQKKGQG